MVAHCALLRPPITRPQSIGGDCGQAEIDRAIDQTMICDPDQLGSHSIGFLIIFWLFFGLPIYFFIFPSFFGNVAGETTMFKSPKIHQITELQDNLLQLFLPFSPHSKRALNAAPEKL